MNLTRSMGLRLAILVLVSGGGGFLGGCQGREGEDVSGESEAEAASPVLEGFTLVVEDSAFSRPASVLHDPEADLYLVANMGQGSREGDQDGFISRLSPEGEVLEARWVAGGDPGKTLHSPRGMALVEDTLFVADTDCLRRFHRLTGESLQDLCMDRVGLLADVAATGRGHVYFTDQGTPTTPGGIFLLRQQADVPQQVTLADGTVLGGEELGGAAGILVDRRGLYFVTSRSGEIWHVTPRGEMNRVAPPWGVGLNGIVSVEDRGFLLSSEGDSALYWVGAGGRVSPVLRSVPGPGDLGYDSIRGRVLVPLPGEGAIMIREVR